MSEKSAFQSFEMILFITYITEGKTQAQNKWLLFSTKFHENRLRDGL